MYRISAIWMNQMPCSITTIARTVGSRAPAGFDDTLQATQQDAAYSFKILMKTCKFGVVHLPRHYIVLRNAKAREGLFYRCYARHRLDISTSQCTLSDSLLNHLNRRCRRA